MNLCRASHLAAALGEKMGSLNLKIPPPQSLCPHARQVLAMWGQRWPALVPSPERAPEQEADGLQTAWQCASFPVFWVVAARPCSRGSRGEGEHRVLACLGMAAAGDRRATNSCTDPASSPASPQGSSVPTSPPAHHSKMAGRLSSVSLFKRQCSCPRPFPRIMAAAQES